MPEPTHISAVIARWTQRAEEWARLGVTVDGAKLAAAIVEDLRSIEQTEADELLTLDEAGEVGGYHPDSLRRLIREGRLHNAGTELRPRIRRADVPRKARREPCSTKAIARSGAPAVQSSPFDAITREAIAGRIGR